MIDLINLGNFQDALILGQSLEQSSENNPNVLITPHIAGVTIDAQEKAYRRVLEKI